MAALQQSGDFLEISDMGKLFWIHGRHGFLPDFDTLHPQEKKVRQIYAGLLDTLLDVPSSWGAHADCPGHVLLRLYRDFN